MKNLTKPITTATASLAICLSSLNLVSCNDTTHQANQAKQEAEALIAEKTQALEIREQNTQNQLAEAKALLATSDQKERIAQEKLTQAHQLTSKYEQAHQLATQQLLSANKTQQLAANQQQEALHLSAEQRTTKAKLESELAKTSQLKADLDQSLQATRSAEDLAKQQIATAQLKLAEAQKLTQDAVQVDAETRGAHLHIQQLERILEENNRAYNKLKKDYHHLSRSYIELKKKSKPKTP